MDRTILGISGLALVCVGLVMGAPHAVLGGAMVAGGAFGARRFAPLLWAAPAGGALLAVAGVLLGSGAAWMNALYWGATLVSIIVGTSAAVGATPLRAARKPAMARVTAATSRIYL